MKKLILLSLAIIQLLGLAASGVFAQDKAPLSEKDLERYTYHFDIADNQFTGDGAKFLTDEIGKNQFVLLGEYHGSLRISEFTRALIPVFHNAGCRNFGLEIGPISSEMLGEFSRDSSKTVENLKAFNSRYYVKGKNRNFTPIPFFSNVEDAEFLAEAASRKWNLIGLDQEFAFSYIPLVDRMYANLNAGKKKELKDLHDKIVKSINSFYEADAKENKNPYIAIYESKEINQFLSAASEKNPKNQAIAEAIKITTDIYRNNADTIRKYYAANSDRVNYMKKNLRERFAGLGFNPQKDKMLLKMGSVHTGRGFSPLSLFEMGNMLSELAEFNGNRSLHIAFNSRFYVENGKEIDALDDQKGFDYRFKALLQMAKKDQWTIIDLRPLRQDVFYRRKYSIDEVVLEIFKGQDFYIIPKMDNDPTPNFVLRSDKAN